MTNPTDPTPSLAQPKPHTKKFTGEYYRALADGSKGVDAETFADALNHAGYLADLAAASTFNCRRRKKFSDRETAERAAAGARNRARLFLVVIGAWCSENILRGKP